MEPTVEGQSSVTQPTNTVDSTPVTAPTETPFNPGKSQAINLQDIDPSFQVAARSEKPATTTVSDNTVAVEQAPNVTPLAEQAQFLRPAELKPSTPVTTVDTQVSATPTTEKKSVVERIKSFFNM